MAQAKPFTWVVRFTIDPLWAQDGFTIGDDRALEMLAQAVGGARSDELSAQVLEAPSPLQLARIQGYNPKDPRSGKVVRDLIADAPHQGQLRGALLKAYQLLDSVAFVAREGDTAPVLESIKRALELIDTRQGEPVDIEE